MKYKTFAALRVAGLALVAVGGFVGCRAMTAPRDTASNTSTAPVGNVPSDTDLTVTAPPANVAQSSGKMSSGTKQGVKSSQAARTGGATEAIDSWQKEVIDMQKQPLTNGETKNGSRKWVVNGGGMHAEFRSDTDKGATNWNRVKIDLNGNKRDDERWDFKADGSVKRRVSPNDDENFTEEYKLQGDHWVKKAAK